MNGPNRFERFRMRMMGLENEDKIIKEIPINDHESYIALKAVQDVSNNRNEDPEVSKAMDGKRVSIFRTTIRVYEHEPRL